MLSPVESIVQDCTKCAETLPLRAFSRDARAKRGVRGVCKRCDRRAVRARRVRRELDQRRLVVVSPRPVRDPSTSLASAAEQTIAALSPPAADADALLIRSLRDVAVIADLALGEGDVRGYCRSTGLLIRILRELRATRASM